MASGSTALLHAGRLPPVPAPPLPHRGRRRRPDPRATGRCILVAEPRVDWDPFILGVATPREIHYMAKAELWSNRGCSPGDALAQRVPGRPRRRRPAAISEAGRSCCRTARCSGSSRRAPRSRSADRLAPRRRPARARHRRAARPDLHARDERILPTRSAIGSGSRIRHRRRPSRSGPSDGRAAKALTRRVEEAITELRSYGRRHAGSTSGVIDSLAALFLLGWAVAASLLAALYLRQRRTGDATAVDAGWGASLVLIALVYALLAPGCSSSASLIASMVVLENAPRRLARPAPGAARARTRATRSSARAGARRGREQLTFAIFYQAQAALAVILSGPVLLAAFNRDHGLARRRSGPALALWLVAAGASAVADGQLAALQGRSREPRDDAVRSRALALLAAPELLLPVADVVRVRARRPRRAVGLDRLLRAGAHPLPRSVRHRHPTVRGVVVAHPRRCLPPLPGADVRLRPMARRSGSISPEWRLGNA